MRGKKRKDYSLKKNRKVQREWATEFNSKDNSNSQSKKINLQVNTAKKVQGPEDGKNSQTDAVEEIQNLEVDLEVDFKNLI